MTIKLLTKRTRLRFIKISDLDSIHKLHSFPETDRYNTLGIPKNIEETRAVIKPWIAENKLNEIRNFTFAIENNVNKQFIGLFGLQLGQYKYKLAEVWYKILPDHWNKGIATEVLGRMVDFGFGELKLHRIQAGCAVENLSSIKVLEKNGFRYEGRRRKILPLKSGWVDNYEYAILETDERKLKGTKLK